MMNGMMMMGEDSSSSFTDPQSLTHPFTQSFTQPFTQPLTHSLSQSPAAVTKTTPSFTPSQPPFRAVFNRDMSGSMNSGIGGDSMYGGGTSMKKQDEHFSSNYGGPMSGPMGSGVGGRSNRTNRGSVGGIMDDSSNYRGMSSFEGNNLSSNYSFNRGTSFPVNSSPSNQNSASMYGGVSEGMNFNSSYGNSNISSVNKSFIRDPNYFLPADHLSKHNFMGSQSK